MSEQTTSIEITKPKAKGKKKIGSRDGNYSGKTPGTRRIVVWHKGKQHEAVFHIPTGMTALQGKNAADEFRRNWITQLENGGTVDVRHVPLFENFCLNKYKPFARTILKEDTWKQRTYLLTRLCNEGFGSLHLNQIGAQHILAYRENRLRDKEEGGGGVKAATINAEIIALRAVLTYAVELGYELKRIKCKPLPEPDTGRVKFWTLDEVARVIDAASKSRCKALLPMLVFLLNTGCRKGEAVAAQWSWINFERGMVEIPCNEAWQPKSNRPREVPLSDALRAMLESMPRRTSYLFPPPKGDRYKRFPRRHWDVAKKLAAVGGTIHGTRHTFASIFLQTKPITLLAKVLGHSTTRTTEIYGHLLPGYLEEARNAVNIASDPSAATGETSVVSVARAPRWRRRVYRVRQIPWQRPWEKSAAKPVSPQDAL